jgi:thioredoxin 2
VTGASSEVASRVRSTVVRCPHCGKNNRIPVAGDGVPRCGNCHQPLPWIVDADDGSFDEVAGRAELPVIVDLSAPWCGPCRAVSPALEQVARELAGRIKLVKVDVDASPTVARRFQVQAVPTLLVLQHGEIVARQAGAAPAAALRAWAERALGDL